MKTTMRGDKALMALLSTSLTGVSMVAATQTPVAHAEEYIDCNDLGCPAGGGCHSIVDRDGCFLYCWDGQYYGYLCWCG